MHFYFLPLLNKATVSAIETHLSTFTGPAHWCGTHRTSALHTDPQCWDLAVSWVLSQQLQTPQNKAKEETRGWSHLFSQTHKDLGTRGEAALNNLTETVQTAAAALFITAGEENIALFIFFNHSQMSEQIFKSSFISRGGLMLRKVRHSQLSSVYFSPPEPFVGCVLARKK